MKFCSHCGEPIKEDVKVCPHCGKNNKTNKNMLIYFILMVILFIIFDIGSQLIYKSSYDIISLSKYGNYIILESLWALIVFLMLVWAGNAYIFRRKKISTFKSLGLAFPPVVIAILAFSTNFSNAVAYNPIDVFGLAFYCFTIGLTEEFLCRGWLLTEFIERYGYDYKHVRLSILASALVFGTMHVTNILVGQGVFETIMQIIQTLGLGYLLGTVFYRTRNIWSVVFIHAFYDFSLMLGDISKFVVCTGGTEYASNIISIAATIILFIIYITLGEYNLRKTKIYNLLPEVKELTEKDIKDSRRKADICKSVLILCILSVFFINSSSPERDVQICRPYPSKTISGNYSIKTKYYKNYTFHENNKKSNIYIKDGNYIKEDNETKTQEIITSELNELLVINNKNYNVLAYYDKNENIIHYERYNYLFPGDTITYEYKVPKLERFGVIEFESGEEYVFFTSGDIHYGMIDDDLNLYDLTFDE